MDTSVFRPYTAQPTSIIVFEKRKQTKKVWFFEISEDGYKKTTSKKGRPPIKENDIPLLRTLWNNKAKTDKSFFVEIEKIKQSSNKLFMNFYKYRKPIKNATKLSDVCKPPILGGTPAKKNKEYYGGKYLWANISDIKNKIINDTKIKLSEKGKKYLSNKKIKKGTLLMSFKLTLGKTAFAGQDMYTNEAICGLIPKDKEDKTISEYLYYILPLINYEPYAQRASKGFTLNKDLVSTVEIPFPEKKGRQRIINQLKKMLKDLEDEKERLQREVEKREKRLSDYIVNEIF